jgi:hypothetical protein
MGTDARRIRGVEPLDKRSRHRDCASRDSGLPATLEKRLERYVGCLEHTRPTDHLLDLADEILAALKQLAILGGPVGSRGVERRVAHCAQQLETFRDVAVDELGAQLDRRFETGLVPCPGTTPDPIACLEDEQRGRRFLQRCGGGKPGHAGTDDDDIPGFTCHAEDPPLPRPRHDYNDRMSVAIRRHAILSAHPLTPCDNIERIEVEARVTGGVDFILDYLLEGDMSSVRIAPGHSPRRSDGLWEHTCFEMFVACGSAGYYELNFAPSGEWAAYRFTGYRQDMAPLSLANDPRVTIRQSVRRLELSASLRLPQPDSRRPMSPRAAFAAVVEKEGGTLCYWAARHPAGKPDFHHPDAFVLEL